MWRRGSSVNPTPPSTGASRPCSTPGRTTVMRIHTIAWPGDRAIGRLKGKNRSNRARLTHRVHQGLQIDRFDEVTDETRLLAALDVLVHSITAERDPLQAVMLGGVFHDFVAAAIGQAKV